MGYPVIFTHTDRAALIKAISAYIKCMRSKGRRVTQWPVQAAPDGTYSATLDVCGAFDKSIDSQCRQFPGMSHTHIDLRQYSPGKKVYTRKVKTK